MSEIIKVKKQDKGGADLVEFDLEVPTSFAELSTIPGEERALKMVRNQMKIEARAKEDPRKEHKERAPGMGTVKKEMEEAGITKDELIEFIRSKRAAANT